MLHKPFVVTSSSVLVDALQGVEGEEKLVLMAMARPSINSGKDLV
jgi:hypothetical protein